MVVLYLFSSDKEQINESQYIVSRPGLGSDPPFGPDRESGVTPLVILDPKGSLTVHAYLIKTSKIRVRVMSSFIYKCNACYT